MHKPFPFSLPLFFFFTWDHDLTVLPVSCFIPIFSYTSFPNEFLTGSIQSWLLLLEGPRLTQMSEYVLHYLKRVWPMLGLDKFEIFYYSSRREHSQLEE